MFKRAFYDLFFFSLAIFCIFLSGVVAASFGLLIFAIIFFILGVILSIISAKLPKRKGETTEMNKRMTNQEIWNRIDNIHKDKTIPLSKKLDNIYELSKKLVFE